MRLPNLIDIYIFANINFHFRCFYRCRIYEHGVLHAAYEIGNALRGSVKATVAKHATAPKI